jgi:predicted ATPase
MKRFQKEIMDRRIQFYMSVQGEEIAFADRGLPDQLAFARFHRLKPPKILLENIQQYPYFPVVFIAPPWKEIYSKDMVRDESFEEAERLHQFICTTYRELGYDPVEIPRTDVPERARFITMYLGKVMSHL